MTLQPARSRSTTSSRIASAIWRQLLAGLVVADEGPVEDGHRAGEHALHWLSVATLCAYCHHSTVMGRGRETSPQMIGGRTQREP